MLSPAAVGGEKLHHYDYTPASALMPTKRTGERDEALERAQMWLAGVSGCHEGR